MDLEAIIDAFCDWYDNDEHSSNRNYYKSTISEKAFSNLTKEQFKEFFISFVREGGKVQSKGHRSIGTFTSTLNQKYSSFREYVAEPFALNFNLEDWFGRLDLYPGFGVGIATIFLNRTNPKVFPIMNNKTLNALNSLNFKISSTKNFSNYKKVKSYQDELISEYPQLQDYYKTDALNHFIVSVPKGEFLITTYQQAGRVKDTLEQAEIDFSVSDDEDSIDVYERIKSCENDKSEYISVKGKSYKRNHYLCSLIKRYRDYTCQFCSTKLPIANGNHYIEACHIKPKSEGGKDKMDNILILCPNCHKLFDFADRKNEIRDGDLYTVTINDKTYSVSLS